MSDLEVPGDNFSDAYERAEQRARRNAEGLLNRGLSRRLRIRLGTPTQWRLKQVRPGTLLRDWQDFLRRGRYDSGLEAFTEVSVGGVVLHVGATFRSHHVWPWLWQSPFRRTYMEVWSTPPCEQCTNGYGCRHQTSPFNERHEVLSAIRSAQARFAADMGMSESEVNPDPDM